MCARVKEPFEYNNRRDFHDKLVEWIGDVLYDFLPEHGFEVRDEQIFTAFQIADAMCNNEVHLAEAGLGTGKTIAYLLSAIPYARMTGKPVVIACATTALQEQLVGKQGDIQALSKLLDLDIDVRVAKDPRQYVCDVRATDNMGEFHVMSDEINQWLSQTELGERSEIPTVPDYVWKKIGWNDSMVCETCENRGYCKLVKVREHYKAARDLIIVDHETFFNDLWTREDRIANGQLPLLPNYSAVIFDEGHRILLPAAMQAGQQISKEDIDAIVSSFEELQGAREALSVAVLTLDRVSNVFFEVLGQSVIKRESTERLSIRLSSNLLKVADSLRKALDQLLLELQIEQELYMESLSESVIQGYEMQIENAMKALFYFCKDNCRESIAWVDSRDQSFWVVPKHLNTMLEKQLYRKGLPIIFTSATLSNNGDFDYFARTVGLNNPSKSTIGSPFDLEKQVRIDRNQSYDHKKERFTVGIKELIKRLKENGGRALVLTNSITEVRKLRKALEDYTLPFEILWEDTAERGYLLRRFREEETSVLIGANFWEGIDVPGDALTMVVVWQLPFPKLDPLIELQRKEAKAQGLDPVTTVDYPEMGLKLKQGCGRLIRTKTDQGMIVVLDNTVGMPWEDTVEGALPK